MKHLCFAYNNSLFLCYYIKIKGNVIYSKELPRESAPRWCLWDCGDIHYLLQ